MTMSLLFWGVVDEITASFLGGRGRLSIASRGRSEAQHGRPGDRFYEISQS
jgi:hypothetical protein